MMKKNLLNRQVVRAISLGLSAVMLTTPMTAMAAEGTDVEPASAPEPEVSKPAETTLAAAENAATSAVYATGDADEAIDTVVKTTDTVLNGNSNDWSKDDQKILEAEQALVDTNNDKKLDQPTQVKISGDGYVAPGQVDGVQEELIIAADADDKADAAVEKADDAVDTMASTAASTAGTMSDAQTAVNSKIDEINNAASSAVAELAYVDLQKIVAEAEADYTTAETKYNNAKTAYENAVKEVNDAKAAYDQAIQNAEADVDAALAQLKATEEKAAELEAAAKTAADNYEASSAAMKIIKLQADAADDNSAQWNTTLDSLFAEIMSAYYLPNIEKKEGFTLKGWKKFSDDSRNYFTVEFADGTVKYYNYKLETSHDGLIIFEKTFEDLYTYTDENGKKVEKRETDYNNNLIEGEVEDDVKAGFVENVDTGNGGKTTVVILGSGNTVPETIEGEVSNQNTTYQYDEDGNLIKTVTGTVTTVTKTGVSLIGGTFDDVTSRDAAMNNEKTVKDHEDVEVEETNEEITEGYVIEGGYYIPTFTETIDISVTIDESKDQISDDKMREALEQKVREIVAEYVKAKDKYFFTNTEYYTTSGDDLGENTLETYNSKWDSSDTFSWDDWNGYERTASTTLSITFAKVTTAKQEWDSVFSKDDSEIEAAKRSVVEANGGIYLGYDDSNIAEEGLLGAILTGTHKYVEGVAINDDTLYKTEEDAKAALAEAAKGVLTKGGVEEQKKTVYSYKGTYTQVDTDVKENQKISTTTWKAAEVTCKEDGYGTNDNYVAGVYLFTEWDDDGLDDDLQAFLDAANKKLSDYRKIQAEADVAKNNAISAWEKVEELKAALAEASKSGYDAELATLAGQLAQAEANWQAAKDAYDDIQEKASEMEDEIDSIIDRLKAAEEAAADDGSSNDGSDEGSADDNAPVETPIVLPIALDAPVQPVVQTLAVATPAGGAGQGVVEIDDEDTPLAGEIGDAEGDEEVLIAEGEEDVEEEAIVDIEDEETPLAAGLEADAKMSWWWLLIIALLGATGYKMYKEHQKKKEEAQEA